MLIDEEILIDGKKIFIFGLFVNYFASIGRSNSVLDLLDLQLKEVSLLFEFEGISLRCLKLPASILQLFLVFLSFLRDKQYLLLEFTDIMP